MASFRYKDYDEPMDVRHAAKPRKRKDPEELTGMVRGEKASDNEERFANSLNKYRFSFVFQFEVWVAGSLAGENKNIDFLIERRLPVDLYGRVGHELNIGQRAYDRVRENRLNQALPQMGLGHLLAVKNADTLFETQESSDAWVRENLAYLRV